MIPQRVIIEISASRVEVALLRARSAAASRAERFDRADWPSPFTSALPEVASVVRRLLADLGVGPRRPARATVIFATPGCVTAHSSCPATVSLGAGEEAARLALAGVADFPIETAPSDACLLATDATPRDPAAAAPQRHFVACADAEQRTAALCDALREAGVAVDRLIPAEAVAMADGVRAATGPGDDGAVRAVVWLGEHATTLAVGERSRLLLVRTIATGAEALAEALKRPLRPRAPDAEPVQLSHAGARDLLVAAGVPAPTAQIPGHPTLAGSSLLPHLQPILQRLSVEIKQSLRFGVPEPDRARVRIAIAGPGAAIPGLAAAVGRLAGVPADAAPDPRDDAPAPDSASGGLIAALARCPRLQIALATSTLRAQQTVGRLRRALVCGAAVAAAYIGVEAVDARAALSRERHRLAEMAAQDAADAPRLALRQRVLDARLSLAGVEGRVSAAAGDAADWPALLSVLADVTPPEVRVQSLELTQESGRPLAVMQAHVRLASTPDPATLIRDYVAALQAVPLIESARLGATQRIAIGGRDTQLFDLRLDVLPLPPVFAPQAAAGAATGATP